MWVPCSRCACGWKAYTATGPDSPFDALLFSSCLISLKPVGVFPLPLQGVHDIALSAVRIYSFVSIVFTLCFLLSDRRCSQVVISLHRCCWISTQPGRPPLHRAFWIPEYRRLPGGRFRHLYCGLCIYLAVHCVLLTPSRRPSTG